MTELIRRELKEEVQPDFLKNLRKAVEPYGAGRVLANKAGITYQSLYDVLTLKKATKTTVEKLTKAMAAI